MLEQTYTMVVVFPITIFGLLWGIVNILLVSYIITKIWMFTLN